MRRKTLECRSKEGTAVGLIDAIISISRVLAPSIRKMDEDELAQPVIDALRDLIEDADVLCILRAVSSKYIITEVQAMAWEMHIESIKNKKKR